MALKKLTNFKGITAEYWKINNVIFDAHNNKTRAILALYVSKEAREQSVDNFLERRVFEFDGELSRQEIYPLIKQSNLVLVTPEILEVKDEEGNITTEHADAVYQETNEFFGSEDC